MENFFQLVKSLRLFHWLLLLAVTSLGVAGTFSIGHYIEQDAIKSWIRQAELDAGSATAAAQGWLAQSETIVNGLAVGFPDPEKISIDEFDELVFKSEEWNSEFTLDGVAIVRRVLRSQREQIEATLGQPFSTVSDPDVSAPDAFVHMVVTHSTDTGGPLRIGADLNTATELGLVPTTAQRVPDQAIMGPAYTAENGRLYTLVGVGVAKGDGNTIVVGRVDLTEMTDAVLSDLPDGIRLRLSERETESGVETALRPILGPLMAPPDAVHTLTIRVTRGQARWNYNWDVLANYLGGAPTANATMFQIGGLIITILIVYSVAMLSVQNVVIKRMVEERTKALTDEVAAHIVTEKTLREARDSLERANEEIRNANADLELRVEERTEELRQEINERKRAEEELIASKESAERANLAKSDFLASMSHELRTPLNSVIGFSEMMSNEVFGKLGDERYEGYLNDIQRSGYLLLNLVNDVLDLSKIEAGKFELEEERVDLDAALRLGLEMIGGRKDARSLTLRYEPADRPLHIWADERAIKQVTLNLLSNAVKYNVEGGEVVLAANTEQDNSITFSVSDTGFGIAAQDIRKVLEPFGQVRDDAHRAHEGTGLGLPLSKELVELHGGTLEIQSEPDIGTTIIVRFPPERTI